ncbi:response regulator [Bosea sp. RAF48]|uniref:response regulator n=1 Tax=Bosea sp. RAF48 TaxID=3237480 RepID=UPI003F93DDC7
MIHASPHVRPTILIVEDEPLLLMDAIDMVEEAGFEAVEAFNADRAIEILASRSDIRIVLTDIEMPGSMDGVKLAQYVRDRWPPIEIIIVSGHRTVAAEDMPDRGLFFSKPYNRHALASAMRRLAS